MKILVTLPQSQSSKDLKNFSEGVKFLKKIGHNVIEVNSDSKSQKDLSKTFNQIDKYIKDSDILLTEVTNADSKVGYEIARALDEKKVVIALEDEKSKNTLSVVHGNNTKQLVHRRYNEKNIVEVVEDALKEAEGKLDSKFILIISPEMDRYLNWASKTKRTHKAQIVRSAVEQMMKKDKDYREY